MFHEELGANGDKFCENDCHLFSIMMVNQTKLGFVAHIRTLFVMYYYVNMYYAV